MLLTNLLRVMIWSIRWCGGGPAPMEEKPAPLYAGLTADDAVSAAVRSVVGSTVSREHKDNGTAVVHRAGDELQWSVVVAIVRVGFFILVFGVRFGFRRITDSLIQI